MNHSNNAFSVLNGSITNVATAITVATGTGSRFPASNFMVTLVGYDGSGNENAWEICLCSSRSGDVLTVVRGREGTTAVAWANATRIENRLTAGTMGNLLYLDQGGTVTGPVTLMNGAYTAFKVGLTGLVSIGGEAGSADSRFTITNGGAVGLEFSQTAIAGQNRILSYNRLATAFVPLSLAASEVRFNISGTDRLTLDASGNLRVPTGNLFVGGGAAAWDSSAKASVTRFYSAIYEATGGDGGFVHNAYLSGASTWTYIGNAGAGRYQNDFGTHRWWTAPSGASGTAATFTNTMTLDNSGNLNTTGRIRQTAGSDEGSGFCRWSDGTIGYEAAYWLDWNTGPNTARTRKMSLDLYGNLMLGDTSTVPLAGINRGMVIGKSTDAHSGVALVNSSGNWLNWANGTELRWFTLGQDKMILRTDGTLTLHGGAFGYGAGAGGIGTAVAGGPTGWQVTINKPSGQINVTGAAIGAGAARSIRLTNSFIAGIDVVAAGFLFGYGTSGAYTLTTQTGTGFVDLIIRNETGGSLTEQLYIQFTVIKGATS